MERWFEARKGITTVLCSLIWIHTSQGKIKYSNGDLFTGTFHSGHIEGKGTLKCTNGVEYVGDWKGSLVSGLF